MTPTQVLEHLASILFHSANYDRLGNVDVPNIAVRLGYGNRLQVPAGLDQGNCGPNMSAGYITIYISGTSQDCKAHGFKEIEGQQYSVSETLDDARITVHARRCGSFDLLHRLKKEFCHPGNSLPFHEDIIHAEFGQILDVTALAQGDEFEDRAESVLTVRFRDITIKKLPCVTYCATEIQKNQKEQETSLCR